MKILFLLFLITFTFSDSVLSLKTDAEESKITCLDDSSENIIWPLFIFFSRSKANSIIVKFYLSTTTHRKSVEISPTDLTRLKTSNFNPSKKTYIIVHGYWSGGHKPWVLQLKDKLLDVMHANIILIDWSEGSRKMNYANAAKNTQAASHQIFTFLQQMKCEVDQWNKTSDGIVQWNHLIFVGHSLGAHISGQTAYKLKEYSFWKIERITGLDPAKYCFINIDSSLRLDKYDADFVDIIHTQAGDEGVIDGFGLKENIGHMDFYVNGGIEQPRCMDSTFIWNTMMCSHRLSYTYFIESLIDASTGNGCPFNSYPWNRTFQDAQRILQKKMKGKVCKNCPEMGIYAPKSHKRGVFLVITSTKEPYCKFKCDDFKNVANVIKKLKG